MTEKATMVYALREEPGAYPRTLEDGREVIYEIRASEGSFIAGWRYRDTGAANGHEERFSSHADALRYLEENFDAPLRGRGA